MSAVPVDCLFGPAAECCTYHYVHACFLSDQIALH